MGSVIWPSGEAGRLAARGPAAGRLSHGRPGHASDAPNRGGAREKTFLPESHMVKFGDEGPSTPAGEASRRRVRRVGPAGPTPASPTSPASELAFCINLILQPRRI